jgi:alginate O-acetyltransferase complex protein AlgI
MVFNTFVVWALTGLWHGASWNFVIWGLWFFVFLMIERFLLKGWFEKIPVVSNIYLIVVVMLGWVVFRFTNMEIAWTVIKSLFGANGNAFSSFTTGIQFKSNMFMLAASVIACTPAVRKLGAVLGDFCHSRRILGNVWDVIVYSLIPVILLLLSTACLVGDSYNPFIYFQF